MANTDDKKDKKQAAKARAKKYANQKDVIKLRTLITGLAKKSLKKVGL